MAIMKQRSWTLTVVTLLTSLGVVESARATPAASAQQAYLKASNAGAFHRFGASIATQGDTVVVGAEQEVDSTGAAYAFRDTGAGWIQEAYLKHPDPDNGDFFGESVSISGDTLVVGCPSEDGGSPGVGGDPFDNSVPSSGAALVYVRTGTTWSLQGYLKAPHPDGDLFGQSVAVAGDTIVVGAPLEDSSATGVDGDPLNDDVPGSGAAFVFTRNGTTWSQEAYLKASNTGAGDGFGHSVGISNDTIVVGAWREDSDATGVDGDGSNDDAFQAGAAYVFARQGTDWSQEAYLKASDTASNAAFGASVAVSGDTVLVGAEDANGFEGGSYVFVRNGTSWAHEAELTASNADLGDLFGTSVALEGDRALVGASFEDSQATGLNGDGSDDSASGAGAAYLFLRSGTTWSHQALYIKASNTGAGDQFGTSVALSTTLAAVGAPAEDSATQMPNGAQGDDSATQAGAAYVHDVPESPVVFYCTPKTSSSGCVTQITTSLPSFPPTSGAANYFVNATKVQNQENGLLFAGLAGPAALPFNGGTLCVQPPMKRGPIQGAGGLGVNPCKGSYQTLVNDGNVIPTGLDAGPGNSAWYQYWYRDPLNGAGQLGTALSDAVQLDFE